jgi:hypothetical protein
MRFSGMRDGRQKFTYADRTLLAIQFARFFLLRAEIRALTESITAQIEAVNLRLGSLPDYKDTVVLHCTRMRLIEAL